MANSCSDKLKKKLRKRRSDDDVVTPEFHKRVEEALRRNRELLKRLADS